MRAARTHSGGTAARRNIVIAIVALLLAAGVAWYGWRWYTTPQPPPIDLGANDDAALAMAVDEAREQIRRASGSAAAWGHLGQVLIAHAYAVEARPCLANAERLDPSDPLWPYLQGWADLLDAPEAAAPCFQRALRRCADDSPQQHAARLRLAQTLFDRGEFAEAEKHFRQLLHAQPGNPLVHLGLGGLALAHGDLAAAVTHLRPCTDSPFTQQKACAYLAAIFRRQGDDIQGDAYDRRARQLPKDADWPDPLLDGTKALVVGWQARFFAAENLHRAGRLPQAAELFRSLVRDRPDDTRAAVKLGMVLAELHEYPAAEAVLRQAIARDAGMVQAHFFLSAALFHQAERRPKGPGATQQFEEAAEQARRTLQLQPNHALAHVYLGLSLKNLGRTKAALAALENAVRCGPESVDPHLHLGELLLEVGRRDEGLKSLADAVRVAPESDARPRQALERARKKGMQ